MLSLGFLVAFAALIIIIAMVPGSQNDSEQSGAASGFASTASLSSLLPAASLPDVSNLPNSSALDNSDLPESSIPESGTPDVSSQGSASHQAPSSIPPASSASSIQPPESSASEPLQININTATEKELLQIPGILKMKARLILLYREEHGPFQTVEDLMNVEGIGPELFETILPYIYV